MKFAVLFLLALLAAAPAQAQGWFHRRPAPTPIPTIFATPTATPKPTPLPTPKLPPRELVALPVYDEETSVRLQIFLDNTRVRSRKNRRQNGRIFRQGARRLQEGARPAAGRRGRSATARASAEPYTTYTIRPEDEQFVGEVASQPSEQAKLKAMLYGSLLEFVAERYHAAEDFLRKLNPGMDLEQLKVGDTVKVPNVQPFEIEKLSEKFVPPNPALPRARSSSISARTFLEVREGDKLVAEFPITPGSKTLPAPQGIWKILGIATLPWFRHDEGVLMHGVRTNDFYNIPPGPNNPVGILWMGLNKPGIGIHGTNNPETIGRAGSHGCIRMANWDAARIKDLVTVGNEGDDLPWRRHSVADASPAGSGSLGSTARRDAALRAHRPFAEICSFVRRKPAPSGAARNRPACRASIPAIDAEKTDTSWR